MEEGAATLSDLAALVSQFDDDGARALVRRRLDAGDDPMTLLDECQDGMRIIGEKYEQGTYYTSALIMAGEVLRSILEVLTPEIQHDRPRHGLATMLVCTVQGDIHDVGKSIATTLLKAHGIEIIDLGVDVPPADVADAVVRLRPDVVGLSGLLTEAFDSMRRTVTAIRERTTDWRAPVPIIIGGSPVNQKVCDFAAADRWCNDAVEGARIVRDLLAQPTR